MRIARVLRNPAVWVFIIVTAAGLGSLALLERLGGLEVVRGWLGAKAPLLTIPIHMVISISPIPSDFVCMANGAFYGLWGGMLCNWIGWWLAGLICFWIGRRIARDVAEDAWKRLPETLGKYPFDHPMVLIISRQIPGLGGYLTTYGAGAIGVTWKRHAWCSAIAIAPGSFTLAALGSAVT